MRTMFAEFSQLEYIYGVKEILRLAQRDSKLRLISKTLMRKIILFLMPYVYYARANPIIRNIV